MDLAFILAAFALGFLASWIGLPPLVGYLAAGFLLHAFGYESTAGIDAIADAGVLLLKKVLGKQDEPSLFWLAATPTG